MLTPLCNQKPLGIGSAQSCVTWKNEEQINIKGLFQARSGIECESALKNKFFAHFGQFSKQRIQNIHMSAKLQEKIKTNISKFKSANW